MQTVFLNPIFGYYRGNMASWSLKMALLLLSTSVLTESSDNNSVIQPKKTPAEADVPLVFPNDSSRYKIISNNSTLLEKYLYHTINMSNSEIADILNIEKMKDNTQMSELDRILKDPVDKRLDSSRPNVAYPKSDSELLQQTGANVEKDSLSSHKKHLGIKLLQKESGGIGRWIAMSIAVLLTVAATAYISMLLWKKSLENRYGSRQILVEEDEVHEEYKHSMV